MYLSIKIGRTKWANTSRCSSTFTKVLIIIHVGCSTLMSHILVRVEHERYEMESQLAVPPLDTEDWSYNQILSLTIANKISAFLSLVGSGYIIFRNLRLPERNERLKLTYHRIMLGLSAHDSLSSISIFFGSWAMPEDNLHSDKMIGNYGSWGTCTAQGFFIYYGYLSCVMYNSFLSTYFLLYIRYGWREEQFRAIEPYCFCVVTGITLSISIYLAATESFNPTVVSWCFIQSYPINCEQYEEFECIHGKDTTQLLLFLTFLPICCAFIVIACCMTSLYRHVRSVEAASRKYMVTGRACRRASLSSIRSKEVFQIACLYVGVFVLIWAPPVASIIVTKFFESPSYEAVLISTLILPSQGLLNVLIYARKDISKHVSKAFHKLNSSVVMSRSNAQGVVDLGNQDSLNIADEQRSVDISISGITRGCIDEAKASNEDTVSEYI